MQCSLSKYGSCLLYNLDDAGVGVIAVVSVTLLRRCDSRYVIQAQLVSLIVCDQSSFVSYCICG